MAMIAAVDQVRSRVTTLEDVARDAGVHVSTVSRVMTGASNLSIRPETRERIQRSAERLRYRPNAIARGLKLASTGAVGLLVPSLRNPVYSAIIRGAFTRAFQRGYVVLLAEDRSGGDAAGAYERLAEEGRIDGLLVASARPGHPLLERWSEQRVPCVFVNRRSERGGQNVVMREEDAGALAAEHLIALGHVRLAHLAGPAGLDTARRREAGFRHAAGAADLEPTVVHAGFDEQAGFEAMGDLLSRRPAPTGVFVSNISQAVGAMAGAVRAGRRVPQQLSLLGYDDDPMADFLGTPLTTIRMPLNELGSTAVDAVIDRIEGEPARNTVISTAPELILRDSTAEPTL